MYPDWIRSSHLRCSLKNVVLKNLAKFRGKHLCQSLWMYTDWIRSSHLRCKKGVIKNLTKFTGKQLCQSLFFNKVAGLRPATLLKKRLWHRCFPLNFVKFLKIHFLQNICRQLLLWLNTVSIWKQNIPYLVDVCEVLMLVIYGFTKWSSVTFVYVIFCFVVFNSWEI